MVTACTKRLLLECCMCHQQPFCNSRIVFHCCKHLCVPSPILIRIEILYYCWEGIGVAVVAVLMHSPPDVGSSIWTVE